MKRMILTIFIFSLIFSISFNVKAYKLNNQNVGPRPTYIILDSAKIFTKNIEYSEKWNYNGGPLLLKPHISGLVNITHGFNDLDNGLYGKCFYINDRESDIKYYYLFLKNETNRNETVVHEVGHSLGLKHTQKENNNISVMREFGFNNKAYPLSDDKKGLVAKY